MNSAQPEPAPLEAFLEQYWKDKEAGTVQPLHVYLTSFPGADRTISEEYVRLEGGDPSTIGSAVKDKLRSLRY